MNCWVIKHSVFVCMRHQIYILVKIFICTQVFYFEIFTNYKSKIGKNFALIAFISQGFAPNTSLYENRLMYKPPPDSFCKI